MMSENVSVVIPAFNEEKRISDVLSVLQGIGELAEIIVVDDGSVDKTAEVASAFEGVKVVKMDKNEGKGTALQIGMSEAKYDILLFLDADLVGLKRSHVENMINPVINNEAEMTIGTFTSGRLRTDLSQKMFPFISGQRAFKREVLEGANLKDTGYGVEAAITKHIKKNNVKTAEVLLSDITHVMKEEKLGFSKGAMARINMYKDIATFYLGQTKNAPEEKNPDAAGAAESEIDH